MSSNLRYLITLIFAAASQTVSTSVTVGNVRRYRPFFVSTRALADDAAFKAIESDIIALMATVFDHEAEDITAERTDATTIKLTFKIRDPAKTSTLKTLIESDTIAASITTELGKHTNPTLSALQVTALSAAEIEDLEIEIEELEDEIEELEEEIEELEEEEEEPEGGLQI